MIGIGLESIRAQLALTTEQRQCNERERQDNLKRREIQPRDYAVSSTPRPQAVQRLDAA